jgi:hypothetical protein
MNLRNFNEETKSLNLIKILRFNQFYSGMRNKNMRNEIPKQIENNETKQVNNFCQSDERNRSYTCTVFY